jgi:hypothetical protein
VPPWLNSPPMALRSFPTPMKDAFSSPSIPLSTPAWRRGWCSTVLYQNDPDNSQQMPEPS